MDRDLAALQEVRDCLGHARSARLAMENASQADCDRWAKAIAEAGRRDAMRLARLAVEESGFGVVAGKTIKNIFATEFTWSKIKDMKTAGIINRDEEKGIIDIAHPAGVVAAIVPITNPTSTALFKCLIAIKARCSIVVSPHPRGIKCIGESCRVAYEAARAAGAPEGCIRWLETPTLESTQELMKHRWTSVVLATGGPGLVEAAYSSGNPAIGVGAGNAPAYIHESADVGKAARAIVLGQTFDNGTICASEQHVVCDRSVAARALEEFQSRGAHICNDEEVARMEKIVLRGKRQNADIVGQFPRVIAKMAGFSVPDNTTVLVCPYQGVGWDRPLSIEKLSPVLSFYTVNGEREGFERCEELLRFGGVGHTAAIHAQDSSVIERFGLAMPAMRINVNSPTTQGSIGYTTSLFPSMTLGCGTPGGNIFSDNIGPQHLINVKRLAFVNEAMVDESERLDMNFRNETGETQLPWSRSHQGSNDSARAPSWSPHSARTTPPSRPTVSSSGGATPFGKVSSLSASDIEAIISRGRRS
jgi:acetaldehyde dehydrogenase (acetylating)